MSESLARTHFFGSRKQICDAGTGREPPSRESNEIKAPASPVCRTISALLSRIGDKWTVLVVQTLAEGPRRFNELRREIPSVSQRMLTLTLRNLERDGLVNRTVTPTIPPRVDYELTDLGHSLQKPICGLATWATENVEAIHD